MLLLTLRGMPTLYYGDELGLPDLEIPRSQWRDLLGRDQSRAPIPWPATDSASWLPGQPKCNVAGQLADGGSVLNLCRKLLEIRRRNNALLHGDFVALEHLPIDCMGYLRGGAVAVILNFGTIPARVELPRAGILLASTVDRPLVAVPADMELRPYEGVLVELF